MFTHDKLWSTEQPSEKGGSVREAMNGELKGNAAQELPIPDRQERHTEHSICLRVPPSTTNTRLTASSIPRITCRFKRARTTHNTGRSYLVGAGSGRKAFVARIRRSLPICSGNEN